jgi:hypothetical protein
VTAGRATPRPAMRARAASRTSASLRGLAGSLLTACLALSLVLAPTSAGSDVRVVPGELGGDASASLAARWPVIVDVSKRLAVAGGVERTLALPVRAVLVSLPATRHRPVVAPRVAEPEPPDLIAFGIRRMDGG